MTGNDDSDSPEFLELEPLEEGDGGDAPLEDDAIEPVDDAANSGAHDGEDAFEDVSGGGLDLPDIVSQPKKPDTTEEGLSGGSSAADASGPDSSGEPSTTDALANIVGQRLEGTYEIVEKIGQGGMGTVYAAIQHPLERKVAIKLVKPSDRAEGNELYFKREVRAIHMLRHPNIINIVDFGADANGVLYLITEYLSGRTLRKVIDEDCPLAPIRICNIAAQMLSALDEAHSEGIVHCDLKPANIMLEPDAEGHDFVKVLDFGIAEIKSPNDEVGPHTQEGDLVGTFDYMSPEQIMREGVDGRADVWSVGVLLYEMLTKRRIFHADDGASIIGRVMRADIPRPEEIAEGVPPELSDVVMAALRRDLDRRLESASAMRSRILEARDQIQSRQTTVDPSVEPGDAPSLRETAARPFDPGRRGELQPDSDSPPANNQSEVSADRETSSPADDSAWGGVGESAQTLSSDMSPTDIEVEEVRDIGGDEGEASRDDESLEGVEGEVVDEIASAFDDESLEEALFETDDESSGDLSRVSTLDAEAFEEESSPPADGGSHDDRASSTETQRSKSPSSKSAGVETSLDREEPSESQPPPGSSDTHEPPPRELTGVDVHVEREELRDQLVRSTAEAPERGGRVLHLVGSPECGKSTLVDHVADTFASRDWAIARARGDGPEGASLLPVMQWIAKLADLYRDPHGFLECALDLVGLEVTLEETSQFFADPSARGEAFETLVWDSPEELRRITVRLLHRVLEFVGREMPIVLTLDNFDDDDALLSSCLETFVRDIEQHPLCALITSSEIEARESLESRSRWHVRPIDGFDISQAETYLERQLEPPPPDAIWRTIRRRSNHAPGYLLEWLRWWVKHVESATHPEDLPPDVETVLRDNLHHVDESLRRATSFLAVLGRHFPLDRLEAVTPESLDMASALEELRDRGWVEAWQAYDERMRLELRPDALEDVAYRMLDETTRSRDHRRLIGYYEREETSVELDPHEEALRLAFHYQGLGRDEEAARAWFRAAELRFERCNYTGAARLWREALERIEEHTDLERTHPLRIRTLTRLLETYRALENLDRADSLCDAFPSFRKLPSHLLPDVLMELGRTQLERASYRASLQTFRVLRTEADERGEPVLLLRAMLHLAEIREETGDVQRSAELLMKARRYLATLDGSELGDDFDELRWMIPNRLGALFLGYDRMERAEEAFREARRRARLARAREGFVRVGSNLGALHLKRGRLDRAREHFENAREVARTTGDVLNQARIAINLGVTAMKSDELEAARTILTEARQIAREIGWDEGLEQIARRLEDLDVLLSE